MSKLITKNLMEYDFDTVKVGGAYGERFCDALRRYMSERNETPQSMEELTGISYRMFAYYLSGEKLPTLQSVISICVALRLHSTVSKHLIETSKNTLYYGEVEHIIYQSFLDSCYQNILTVADCNEILDRHGLSALTSLVNVNKDEDE